MDRKTFRETLDGCLAEAGVLRGNGLAFAYLVAICQATMRWLWNYSLIARIIITVLILTWFSIIVYLLFR